MRQSQLFTKTLRTDPKDEVAVNAKLLERGGFIYKNSAGIYSYLPLGWRVMQKIATIIREEMNAIGGLEMFMPALVERKYMEPTKRWDLGVGFDVKSKEDKVANFTLGWTHEEVLTAIASKYVSSYKDLPFSAYQIQTKFRNEARAKSGILRGREFMMKDLYSFHADEADLVRYYDQVKEAYFKVFERCGLDAVYTVAAGGDFTTSNTHEFQVVTDVGEDTIFVCGACGYSENSEISKLSAGAQCPQCGKEVGEKKAIEVGNIFPLGTKYSVPLNLQFTDRDGSRKHVVMGSYGIGVGRVMGTVVEVHHDDDGIIWPEEIAPFAIHLLQFPGGEKEAAKAYEALTREGHEVLFDDRDGSAGEKLADADLLGIPNRVIIGSHSLKKLSAEVKGRSQEAAELISLDKLISFFAGK
jgi:prolyl-tRNA synthetase